MQNTAHKEACLRCKRIVPVAEFRRAWGAPERPRGWCQLCYRWFHEERRREKAQKKGVEEQLESAIALSFAHQSLLKGEGTPEAERVLDAIREGLPDITYENAVELLGEVLAEEDKWIYWMDKRGVLRRKLKAKAREVNGDK